MQHMNKTTGKLRDKRTITLADDTGFSLDATMWGESAQLNLQVGQIIAVKGARSSDFRGRSLNIDFDNSVIQINPDDEERFH